MFAYASLILYELNLLYKYAVSAKSNGHRAKPFADYQVTILFRRFSKPEELIKRSIKQGNRTRILSNSDLAWCLPLKNSYNLTVLIVSIGNICNNHIVYSWESPFWFMLNISSDMCTVNTDYINSVYIWICTVVCNCIQFYLFLTTVHRCILLNLLPRQNVMFFDPGLFAHVGVFVCW